MAIPYAKFHWKSEGVILVILKNEKKTILKARNFLSKQNCTKSVYFDPSQLLLKYITFFTGRPVYGSNAPYCTTPSVIYLKITVCFPFRSSDKLRKSWGILGNYLQCDDMIFLTFQAYPAINFWNRLLPT